MSNTTGTDVARTIQQGTRKVGGYTLESVLGGAAIVLAILALVGLVTVPFTAIAIIVAGVGLLFEGAAVAARGRLERGRDQTLIGGFGAESLTGIGAVTLGILALVGIDAYTLLPVAAIVLGAGMLLAGGAAVKEETGARESAHGTQLAASGLHTLIGAGAVVLGILALLGNSPITLTLVATIAVGTGLVISGVALGSRMAGLFEQRA